MPTGKEVVVCGEAYYGGLGFTHEAYDPFSLLRILENLTRSAKGQLNHDLSAAKFLYIFLELHSVHRDPIAVASLVNRQLHSFGKSNNLLQ
eukprot:6674037-Pyramimonas_sp.AAC.1